jgi:hypothetical protein
MELNFTWAVEQVTINKREQSGVKYLMIKAREITQQIFPQTIE